MRQKNVLAGNSNQTNLADSAKLVWFEFIAKKLGVVLKKWPIRDIKPVELGLQKRFWISSSSSIPTSVYRMQQESRGFWAVWATRKRRRRRQPQLLSDMLLFLLLFYAAAEVADGVAGTTNSQQSPHYRGTSASVLKAACPFVDNRPSAGALKSGKFILKYLKSRVEKLDLIWLQVVFLL